MFSGGGGGPPPPYLPHPFGPPQHPHWADDGGLFGADRPPSVLDAELGVTYGGIKAALRPAGVTVFDSTTSSD